MSWLVGIALSAVGGLILAEAKGWIWWCAGWLLRLAVARLPRAYRSRLQEEWSATLEDYLDRPVSRVAAAIGFVFAAARIGHDSRLPHVSLSTAAAIRTFDVAVGLILLPPAAICALAGLCTISARGRKFSAVFSRGSFVGRGLEPFESWFISGFETRVVGWEERSLERLISLWHIVKGDMAIVGAPLVEETIAGVFGYAVRAYPQDIRSQIREVRKRQPKDALIFDATLTLEKVKPGLLSAVLLNPNDSAESFVSRYSVSHYLSLCGRWIVWRGRNRL